MTKRKGPGEKKSELPACDTPEAEGMAPDSGMRHTRLVVIANGAYTDTVRCQRCKREFPVAASR